MARASKDSTWRGTILLNTLAGLIPPLLLLLFADRVTSAWLWRAFVYSMIYSWSIGTLVTIALMWADPKLSGRSKAVAWTGLLAILAASAGLGCFVASGIIMSLPIAPPVSFGRMFRQSLGFGVPVCVGIGVVIGLVEDYRTRLKTSELQLRTRELERERAEKTAAEARLSSLESRIHPHFLFNALNSISSLIREDPGKAERLIEQLSTLLRFSLDTSHGLVSLERELKVVRDYLDIERARFGERLRFSIDLPDELRDSRVPPLAVQTLVENAVKHAIAPRREGGTVSIRATGDSGAVRIEVTDDGPGFAPSELKQGHGLDLLQARLATIFGDRAALDIDGSAVTVRLPDDTRIRS